MALPTGTYDTPTRNPRANYARLRRAPRAGGGGSAGLVCIGSLQRGAPAPRAPHTHTPTALLAPQSTPLVSRVCVHVRAARHRAGPGPVQSREAHRLSKTLSKYTPPKTGPAHLARLRAHALRSAALPKLYCGILGPPRPISHPHISRPPRLQRQGVSPSHPQCFPKVGSRPRSKRGPARELPWERRPPPTGAPPNQENT